MFKAVRIPAVAESAQGGNVAGHQATGSGGPGKGDQLGVDVLTVLVKADFFQSNGLGLKGGGVDDLAARFRVAPLKTNKNLRIAQHPFLSGHAVGHAHFSQIGAGGPVQKPGACPQ